MSGLGSVSGSGYPPVRGTTPLDPAVLQEIQQPAETAPESAVDVAGAVDEAASEVSVRNLASDDMSGSVAFPNVSEAEQTRLNDVTQLLNGLPENMGAEQAQRLQKMATELGFNSLEMMQHHMRNLKPEHKQQLQAQLRSAFTQSEIQDDNIVSDGKTGKQEANRNDPSALAPQTQQVFESFFRQATSESFHSVGAELPVFEVPEASQGQARWDTASLTSVFNAIEQVRQTDPDRLALIGKEPVTFRRHADPQIHTTDNFMNVLTQATAIASTNAEERVINLYGTAVSGDHTEITDRVVDQLQLVTRLEPSGKQIDPRYTRTELGKRSLDRQPGETTQSHNQRMVDTLLDNYSRLQFNGEATQNPGEAPPPEGVKNLQEAVNFIIGFRGLDIPRIENYDGDINNTQLRYALGAMQSTYVTDGARLMQQVAARAEQQQGMRNIQQFLVDNAPPGAETIEVDGILGDNTRSTVQAFEVGLALNTLKERIEDDPQLPESEKVVLLDEMNQHFRELASQPQNSRQILENVKEDLNELLQRQDLQFAPHTREAIQNDLSQLGELGDGRFDRRTTGALVSNWLNVMDSGQGFDLGEQLVMHETSHIWDTALNAEKPALRIAENWAQLFDPALQGEGGFSTNQMNTTDYTDRLHDDQASSSDYGSISAREDFAEATRIFSYDPQRLMRRSLMKFLFVNAMTSPEKRYDAQQIRDMAHESGYTDDQIRTRLNTFLGHNTSGNNVQFTAGMSGLLNKTYQPLSHELNTSAVIQNPSRFSFELDNTTPEVSLSEQFDLGDYSLRAPEVEGFNAFRFNQAPSLGQMQLRLDSETSSALPDWAQMSTLYNQELTLETPSVLLQQGLNVIPPPTETESGYVLDAISERYRDFLDGHSSNGKPMQPEDMNHLIQKFVEGGPAAVAEEMELPPSAVAAVEAAIERRFQGQEVTPQQRKEAYAVMATLALGRVSGEINPGAYPALSENLPAAFDTLMQRADMKDIFQENNVDLYAPTYLFEGTLNEMDWTAERLSEVQQGMAGGYDYFTVMQSMMESIPNLPPHYATLMQSANLPIDQAFQVADQMLDMPAVKDFFASNREIIQMAAVPMQQAFTSMGLSQNIASRIITDMQSDFAGDQLARYMLAAYLSGQNTQGAYSGFMRSQMHDVISGAS